MKKKCTKCLKLKDTSAFGWKCESYQRSRCKECCLKDQRAWYKKNKAKVISRSLKNKQHLREELRVLSAKAKNKPCADCRKKYPHWVMQFDHVRGKKLGCVSTMVAQGQSKNRVLAEVAKCEVVCANCHANRTYQRLKKG